MELEEKELEDLAEDCVGICDSDLQEQGATSGLIMQAYQRKKIFKRGFRIATKQMQKKLDAKKAEIERLVKMINNDINKIRKLT